MNKEVLIYYSPFIEIRPKYMGWPIVYLYPYIANFFIKKGYRVLLICGSDVKDFVNSPLYENIELHFIDQTSLLEFCMSSTTFKCNSYFKDTQDSKDQIKMSEFIEKLLGKNFSPQYIFTYLNEVPFLKKLFPKAIIFRNEIGWATPNDFYNLSFYFDNYGILENSSIFNYTNDIKSIDLSKEDEVSIEKFQTKMTLLYSILSPYKSWISELKKQYKQVLVLAGTGDYRYFHSYLTTSSKNFLDFVIRVAKSVPENYAIIITLHPSFDSREICSEVEEYINNKYPNIIMKYNGEFIKSNTELLLVFCDGLIAGESKLFHEALIMKKPFFYIAITGYKHFSVGHVSEIKDYFEKNNNTALSEYTKLIYWLLTYYFIYLSDIQDESFMNKFLEKFIETNSNIKNYSIEESINKLIKNNYLLDIKKTIANFINPELISIRDNLSYEVMQLKDNLQSLQEELMRSRSENDILKNNANSLEKTLDLVIHERDNLNAILKNNANSLQKTLDLAIYEKDNLNKIIRGLKNSNSWKYTKPLRKLSELFR